MHIGKVTTEPLVRRVVAKECCATGRIIQMAGLIASMTFRSCQLRSHTTRILRAVLRQPVFPMAWGTLAVLLLAVPGMLAQVLVDSVTSGTTSNTGSAAFTFSVSHTTLGANRLMVVGISLNNSGNAGTTVTRVCYGGTGAAGCPLGQTLTRALQAEANNIRVEIWYVVAPTVTTAGVVVTVNKTGSGNRLGVTAGVITFTGVEGTSPIHASNSASGNSSIASATVTAAQSDMVLDTVAVTNNSAITTPSPQTSQWNLASGTIGGNVGGAGSTCTGSSCSGTVPTVSMTENLGTGGNWTIGVISIRAFGADFSLTKVGSPEPVLQGTPLTYTLTVTNNGLQNAPGVLVVDALPSQVTYNSSSWTNGVNSGACSQAAGTVSCTIGAMASGGTATVTIVTTAVTPSLAINNAVVSPVGVLDPDFTNNTATFTSTIEFPNSVRMNSFTAVPIPKGAMLSWNSGGELHNLGFNVYRDVNGEKVRLNSSLIAGSALLMRDTVEQHAAKSYRWIDHLPAAGGSYWIEDVDLNGTRTLHGPISVDPSNTTAGAGTNSVDMARSAMIQDLATPVKRNSSTAADMTPSAVPVARVREVAANPHLDASSRELGFKLAASPAVKITVDHEGWYRVAQSQLAAAGLGTIVDAKSLHLYAEGVEQPVKITGGDRFGPQSAIEFYGTGIDTPFSGQRVYWLTQGRGPGLRVADSGNAGSAGPQAQSFMQTVELKPRTTYFATLLHENIDDFFGPLVSSVPESETVNMSNLAVGEGQLAIMLQGVTEGQTHTVTVMLNGATLGELNFAGQNQGRAEFQIPAGVLMSGENKITLLAQQGENDLSLVDTIDVSFPHTFSAESDMLKFTAVAGQAVSVGGFSHPARRLIDITDPVRPREVKHELAFEDGSYTLTANIPWTTPGPHTLLALSESQFAAPLTLTHHDPTHLHAAAVGSEYVILTAPQFVAEAQPLAAFHRNEGKSVAMVSVDDVYDEFSFGERTPFAIRDFLKTATDTWKNTPKYLLLVGDASVDPRDYLGLGSFDFVPTKLIATAELMTASDDWFSDFENNGTAKIPTGRLPVRSPEDERIIISKILSYAHGTASDWNSRALMVADADDPTMSFSQQSQAVQQLLPKSITSTDIFADTLGIGAARQSLVDGINNGQLLVNYNGHGSVEVWSSGALFDRTQAGVLTNGNKLPLFVIMNCLNGFFHDVYTESMAEALMLSPNGGAVAVWASSGLTAPDPQFAMDRALANDLFAGPNVALGDAVLGAKSSIDDRDVKRTFILFGDPAMRLRVPQTAPAKATAGAKPVGQPAARIRRNEPSSAIGMKPALRAAD